jgi:DNA-binding IclR family transcriptional regulator
MAQRRAVDERKRISARPQREQKSVKSAERVLEILEYFDDVQRPATVMEIADSLDYPQSSTSALLKTLVGLGYLNCDPRSRTYVTSNRVALLGSWMNSSFFAEGAIISLMKELNQITGDTIVLAMRHGLCVQYIHVIQATSPARLHMTLGTVRPIAASGAGYALLSSMSDAEVTRLVMRINAEAEDGQPLIKIRDVLDELARIREKGYAFTCDLVTPGGGILATTLPRAAGQPLMVIGIGGISEVMRRRERELADILNAKIEERFGVRDVAAPAHRETAPWPARVLSAEYAG